MKSMYDNFGNEEKTPAAPPPPAAAAAKPETARTDSKPSAAPPAAAGPGGRRVVTVLCVVNLVLLALILGFQVKIMLWQSGITAALRKLENEVNQEKVQRAELGDNLLKKIDELTPAKEPPTAVPTATLTGNATAYTSPSPKAKAAGKLKKGQTVTVTEKKGEWRKISWDGKSGWVKAALLK